MRSFDGTSQFVSVKDPKVTRIPCSSYTFMHISEDDSPPFSLLNIVVFGVPEHARIPLGGREGELQLEEVHGPGVS